jgi:hypothetical protein
MRLNDSVRGSTRRAGAKAMTSGSALSKVPAPKMVGMAVRVDDGPDRLVRLLRDDARQPSAPRIGVERIDQDDRLVANDGCSAERQGLTLSVTCATVKSVRQGRTRKMSICLSS